MDDEQLKAKLATLPWRTPASLRAIYERNPTRETLALLWEVRRLQAVICEDFRKFDKGCAQPELAGNMLRFGAIHAAEEPCVKAMLDAEWERRHELGTRYYSVRHLAERPEYRPPAAPDQRPRNLGERAAASAGARGEPPPLPVNNAGKLLRPGNRYVPK